MSETALAPVRAWDLPTRLFKWTLVALVFLAWASHEWGDVTQKWHKLNGYAILTLVLFRLLWGLFGSSTARFGHWIYGPVTVARHGADLVRGRHENWLGHTPLGGWMALALVLVLGAEGVAGLFTADSNDVFGGPFAHTDFMSEASRLQTLMSWFHHRVWTVLLVLVAAHVAVGLIHQFVFKDGLIVSMITGKKRAAPFRDTAPMQPGKALWLRAVLCLIAAAAIVLGSITLAGGSLL